MALPVLYHGDRTRSLRVRWVLEELGVPYEVRPVLFPARIRQPEFLQENPLGSLPLFVDGEVRMTESMAICEYLGAKHSTPPLAVAPDEAGFGAYRQFCWFGEASLMPPVGSLVGLMLLTPPEERSPKLLEEAHALLARRLQPVADALLESEYLAAGRFSLADVSVSYALGLAAMLGAGERYGEAIVQYRERLAARPAYVRACVPVNT